MEPQAYESLGAYRHRFKYYIQVGCRVTLHEHTIRTGRDWQTKILGLLNRRCAHSQCSLLRHVMWVVCMEDTFPNTDFVYCKDCSNVGV